MHARFLVLTLFLVLAQGDRLEAQLGTAFTYQGELNQEGLPTDGEFDLEFRLFSDAAGTMPVGGVVSHGDVPTSDGRFTVALDFGQVFNGNALWLQIRVRPGASTNPGDFVTLSPLQPLTAAPFAHYALGGEGGGDHAHHSLDAEDGNPQDAVFVDAVGRVGIGTTSPTAELHIDGSASASTTVRVDHPGAATGDLSISSPGGSVGLIAHANNGNRRDVRFTDEGISLLTNSAPTIPAALNGIHIFEDGRVGVGSTTINGQLDVEASTGHGIYASTSQSAGRAVSGYATGSGINYGVWGRSDSTDGRGVFGVAAPSGGITYGVLGRSNSTDGRGVYGEVIAGSGLTYGVFGRSLSTSGRGVFGWASASSGLTYGVHGESFSTIGRGVYGHATATSGFTIGVSGRSESSDGYGVFSNGELGATGTKSFVIDHPFDPENQYLKHYSAEGPEPLNIYLGRVTLDGLGEAWVDLPEYFEAINRDPRYTLTPIGAAMPNLHVASEVYDNQFQIAGGLPGMKVSWEVKAVRDDPYVRQRGAPVEVDKPEEQRGLYQHPELYGQPPEKGMDYQTHEVEAGQGSP